MIKNAIVGAAQTFAPRWTENTRMRRWIIQSALELKSKCDQCRTIEDKVDIVLQSKLIAACQKRSEITALLYKIHALKPEHVCEIGTANGGTLFLFCQVAAPNARLLSIDVNYSMPKQLAFPKFATRGQHITCLKADSHSDETLAKVRNWLGSRSIDFLFIDGDHSLNGVRSDYVMYSPLVRVGGLVGFHDIVPDFRTRFGIPTPADVGEVPAFWQSIKSENAECLEFVEDQAQDGLGIGLIQLKAGGAFHDSRKT